MIELDTQIMPTARVMSFLFWACSAFKVFKVSYVIVEEEVVSTIAPLCTSAIFGYNVVAGDLVLRRVGGP